MEIKLSKEEKVERFIRAVSETWKPVNRVRQPLYTEARQLEPKHPLLFGEEWRDIEIILRDCPWRYMQYTSPKTAMKGEHWGRTKGMSPYDCLHTGTIAEMPLERIAAKDAIMLDWVTFPKLNEAIEAVEFRRNKNGNPIWRYKACPFVWVKVTPQARNNWLKLCQMMDKGDILYTDMWEWFLGIKTIPGLPGLWHRGTGYYSMANVEICALYTKGSPSFRINKDVGSLIIEPVGEHSAKPRGIYDKIDRLFGTERKRAELFARRSNPPPDDWLATGLEWDGMDICEALGMDRRFWYKNQPKFEPVETDGSDGSD